jgi:hypothetical protein
VTVKKTMVALFDDLETAESAVRALRAAGVAGERVSLVARNAGDAGAGAMATGKPADAAGAGAGVGALAGGLGGLLLGLGALTITGIGPVLAAGPLGTALSALLGAGAGAVAGGVTGGLLGALVDMGVPEDEAEYYAEGVRRGGALVAAEVEGTADAAAAAADRIRAVLAEHSPLDLRDRAATWRERGWRGYDEAAPAFDDEETRRERELLRMRDVANMPPVAGDTGLGLPGAAGADAPDEMRAATDWTDDDAGRDTAGGLEVKVEVDEVAFTVDETAGRPVAEEGEPGGEAERGTLQAAWRGHYQSRLATSGKRYEHFEPAYYYGWHLGREARYQDDDWDRLEPEARATWERRNPGSRWLEVHEAVRHGWEQAQQRV